jgi:hypothetical protein
MISRLDALPLIRATMIVSTAAWAAGEVLMRRSRRLDAWARAAWTAGIVLALAHALLAFDVVYGWSHSRAAAATMEQAADRFGWGWRGAIYVNYAFLVLWLTDVCWWWVARDAHAARPLKLEAARLAIFIVMFLNGAVVFASGTGRAVGLISLAAVIAAPGALAARRVPA